MTTQPTLTLADFLLARIAEDEAAARKAQAIYDQDVPVDSRLLGVLVVPARVLADCEAKRRIVEWGADQIAQWTIEREERERSLSMLAKPEHFIPGLPRLPEGLVPLRMLAQPYADHPDYREEWRP